MYIRALCKKVWQELIDQNDPVIKEIDVCIGEYKEGKWYDFNGWYISNYAEFVGMYVANFSVWWNDGWDGLKTFEKICFIAWLIEWSDFGTLLCRVGK